MSESLHVPEIRNKPILSLGNFAITTGDVMKIFNLGNFRSWKWKK